MHHYSLVIWTEVYSDLKEKNEKKGLGKGKITSRIFGIFMAGGGGQKNAACFLTPERK